MKPMMLGVAGFCVISSWAGQAFGQSHGPSTITRCTVVASSAEAGRLEVTKLIQPPKIEAAYPAAGLVFSHWSPTSIGSSLTTTISYVAHDQDSALAGITGVDFKFSAPKDVKQDQLSAELIADGMAPRHLNRPGEEFGTGKYSFVLDGNDPEDRAMGHLIGTGALVKLVIFQSDWVFQPEVFEGTEMRLRVLSKPKPIISEEIDTKAIAARDALFVQAKGRVVAQDPTVCKTLQIVNGVLVDENAGD